MKPFIAFLAGVAFLVVLQPLCAQEPDPGDQKAIKALEAEREKLAKRLAEIDADLARLKRPPPPPARPVTLRYSLPVQGAEKKSSATRWELAAPVVGGFSDPNEIVYDEVYLRRYVGWAVNTPIICGGATYRMATADGVVELHHGLDASYLGQSFRADQLLRFLRARTETKTVERTFRIDDLEVVKGLRERPDSAGASRLRRSPWDRDTQTVLSLLALARVKPAYPHFKALLKDPSPDVRRSAVGALGGIAPAVPEAVKDLARLLPDKELGPAAAEGLTAAGGAGVPALVEAMNHAEWAVRNRAVHALARVSSFEAALPGLLAGLDHRDREVRQWALGVVIDMQGRGVGVGRDPLVDALTRRLADGDEETRQGAARALVNLKSAAARAKPALLKAAAEDRSDRVRHYAQQALKAIDAAKAPDR